MNTNIRKTLLSLLIGSCLVLAACTQDEQQADENMTADQSTENQQEVIKLAGRQATRICRSWSDSQRVKYQLTSSEAVYVSVSSDQAHQSKQPVSAHRAKSEVRAFNVEAGLEYCLKIENQNSVPAQVSVSFSGK